MDRNAPSSFPHPEERTLARVSKDGGESRCVHPSRRLLRKLLRMRSLSFTTSEDWRRSLSSGRASRGPVGHVSKDETFSASWFETAQERLLTMRIVHATA